MPAGCRRSQGEANSDRGGFPMWEARSARRLPWASDRQGHCVTASLGHRGAWGSGPDAVMTFRRRMRA